MSIHITSINKTSNIFSNIRPISPNHSGIWVSGSPQNLSIIWSIKNPQTLLFWSCWIHKLNPHQLHHQYLPWFLTETKQLSFFSSKMHILQPISRLFFENFNIFSAMITNIVKGTSLNRELKVDISTYLKFSLGSYRTCAMAIFVHHPLDVFPLIINMFHFMECTVTPHTKGYTTVLAHH